MIYIFSLIILYPDLGQLAQRVKNLSAIQKTWVRSLGQKDHLEKGMAAHSMTFAWRIPQTEKPGWVQFMGSQRIRHN